MPLPANLSTLKGIGNFSDISFNDCLSTNLVEHLSWGLLSAGAFYNVQIPDTSGAYGGNFFTCRLSDDVNYETGCVWETPRSNWIWESGIPYSTQPTTISGIYLNGSFVPTSATGNLSYTLSYPLGRVIFDNPLPNNSKVQLNFSFKAVSITEATSPWFKQLQFNSFRVDNPQIELFGSGMYSIMAQNRIQLPAIVVEVVPRRKFAGYQMGGGQWLYQDVLFHIFAESSEDRDRLIDVTTFQNNSQIMIFDKNAMYNNMDMPLNYDGSVAPSALCYPNLLNKYAWRGTYFEDTHSQEMVNYTPGFYTAIVRTTTVTDYATI